MSEGTQNPSKIKCVVLYASQLLTIKGGRQHCQSVKLSVEIFETQIVCHMIWVKQEPE